MNPGHFDRIEIGKLKVHPKAQRFLSRKRVAWIAANWNWEAAKPITIVPDPDEPGTYWIADGQHTVKACALRFPDFNGTLPCWVLPARSEKELAALFLLLNDYQRPVDLAAKYKARLNKGDPLALETDRALRKAGIRNVYGSGKLAANETRCGYAFLRARETVGMKGLAIVIQCVKACQQNGAIDPAALRASFIDGAATFAKRGKRPDGQRADAADILKRSGHGRTSDGYRRPEAIADVLEKVWS